MSTNISKDQLIHNLTVSEELVNWGIKTMFHRNKTRKGQKNRGYDARTKEGKAHKKMGLYMGRWVVGAKKPLSGKFVEKGREICIAYADQLHASLLESAMLEYAAAREAENLCFTPKEACSN